MRSKIKQIIETIIESKRSEVRYQLDYLKDSLSEEERFELYESLCMTVAQLTEEDQIARIQQEPHIDITKQYSKIINEQSKLTELISKVEYAASMIQPLSDHSLRGTMHFINKNSNSDEE